MGINIQVSQCWSVLMLMSLLSNLGLIGLSNAQLSTTFYFSTCPRALSIIQQAVTTAINPDPRMGASLLRLHFSDCFVDGCDASVLLDATTGSPGEKTAAQNNNSLRGFEVIDTIKTQLEAACPGVVSCADILAVAAQHSVSLFRGPSWAVRLGRRDSTAASLSAANAQIPSPELNLNALISAFAAKGFTSRELVALSGAHTIGMTRCNTVKNRIYNETNMDQTFAALMRGFCPAAAAAGDDGRVVPLDPTTVVFFDNAYYTNLVGRRGMLHSDQQLFNGGSTDSVVQEYSSNSSTFFNDFAAAMAKMSELGALTGAAGQVRRSCRRIN